MATLWPPANVAFSIFGAEPQSVQNITLSDEKLCLNKFHTFYRTCFQTYIEYVPLAVSKLCLAIRINKIVKKFLPNLIFMFASHSINMWTIAAVMNANAKAVAVPMQCSTNWANKPTKRWSFQCFVMSPWRFLFDSTLVTSMAATIVHILICLIRSSINDLHIFILMYIHFIFLITEK